MPSISILTSEHVDSNPSTRAAIHRLRHKVFKERLAWDVSSQDGLERDEYDSFNPVYLVVRGGTNELEGCWRLLPTTGPYMLKDLFSELLDGSPAPCDPGIWEISRFAVMPQSPDFNSRGGLNALTGQMLIALMEFCLANGIRRVVAASDVRFERILIRAGLKTGRFGPARRIGACLAVAGWTDATEENLDRVRQRCQSHSENFTSTASVGHPGQATVDGAGGLLSLAGLG